MNVLSEIIEKKRERVAEAKEIVSARADASTWLPRCAATRSLMHCINALQRDGINIIAEFKRRSPSKGTIRADANLTEMVQSYEAGGAVGDFSSD